MGKLVCYIVFCFVLFPAVAQVLNSAVSAAQIQIGEPFQLSYQVSFSDTSGSIVYVPKKQVFTAKESDGKSFGAGGSNYDLELLSDFYDSLTRLNGRKTWTGIYQLTAWDSAWVIIPPEMIVINDSTYYFEPVLLEVLSPKADPSKGLFDIREEFTEFEADASAHKWWWFGLGALVFFLVAGFLLFRKKARPQQKVVFVSLRDRIIQEIDTLENSKLYERDLKEYYFELSIIIRKFLGAHFQLRLMERTTGEIATLLLSHKIAPDTIQVIEKLLTQSDMVKFAKSEPPVSDVILITNQARQIIDEVAELNLRIESV